MSNMMAVWMIHASHAALDRVDNIFSQYIDPRRICDCSHLFFMATKKNKGQNITKNIPRWIGLSKRNWLRAIH